jgi:SAM-dependent methyltransferase
MLDQRSYEKELLDKDNIPFGDIRQNLKELEQINSLLGGHRVTRKGAALFLRKITELKRPVHIAEIGCGGGDNLLILQKFFKANNISCRFTGVDIKPECISYAIKKNRALDATWIISDYQLVRWLDGNKPDIIFSSLFCHHFTDDELIAQIHWMNINSELGFFINDLHRHPIAYYSIKYLSAIFSKSYLVKNDAPLSVLRGFKKEEWKTLLLRAGVTRFKMSAEWAFRYLIYVRHE